MINKRIYFVSMLLSLLLPISILLTGCNTNKFQSNYDDTATDYDNNQNEDDKSEVINMLKLTINGAIYKVILEDNETAKGFVNLIGNGKTFNMVELNGNEKYVYLKTSLPVNSYNPKIINTGDVMLFGNNCLVLFYKTFSTSYSYTKIGHIENVSNLQSIVGNSNISAIWQPLNNNK